MAQHFIRGIEAHQEQKPQRLLRDTRTLGEKCSAFMSSPFGASTLLVVAICVYWTPATMELAVLYALILLIVNLKQQTTLPFRLPERSDLPDYNDPQPGSNKPRKARGITFLGNKRQDNQELWFNNDDMRTHVLIFGSTGAGKTEVLVSMVYNALLQGSGFIYVDGKGDNSLFAKVYAMARAMGREDDLLLINFMTGARDIIGPQKTRLSNTMNPFASGSSSMLSNLVVSLMDSSKGGGDGDMWKGRAITFVESLLKLLAYMRDRGDLLLDANTIRNYFVLPKLETMILDKKFPVDNRLIDISDVPALVTEPLYNYLMNLPGYTPAKKGKQGGEVFEQHGFITMQLTRTFTSMADTYGHILRTNLAEVDFRDVVLNRRILVVLLPALEKSPDELANLGKLIVASLKAMMASGLGDEVEGTYQDVIERKPTNAPSPYMCVLDEYGYYAVPGFAVVPAQARSLGFSAIFAGQDLPAFQKASKEEAASIGANTNIKICMKLEDPTETLEFFLKSAGEAFVTTTSGFQTKPTNLTNNYLDNQSAQVEKRNRIDLQDLKEQREGEGHIFFKSKIVRAKMFYANPKMAKVMRVNQFLKVEAPVDDILINIANKINNFTKNITDPHALLSQQLDADADLQMLFSTWQSINARHALIKADDTIDHIYQQERIATTETPATTPTILAADSIPEFGLDIFYNKSSALLNNPLALLELDPMLSTPLLDRNVIQKQLSDIEFITGRSRQESRAIIEKLLMQVSKNTCYPPENLQKIAPEELITTINDMIEFFKKERDKPPPVSTTA